MLSIGYSKSHSHGNARSRTQNSVLPYPLPYKCVNALHSSQAFGTRGRNRGSACELTRNTCHISTRGKSPFREYFLYHIQVTLTLASRDFPSHLGIRRQHSICLMRPVCAPYCINTKNFRTYLLSFALGLYCAVTSLSWHHSS